MSRSRPLLLVFPFGYLSHYLRCLILCRHLRAHFEIRFAHHERYRSFVEGEGYATFEVSSFGEDPVLVLVSRIDFCWLNDQQLERIFLAKAAAIRKYRPAAVGLKKTHNSNQQINDWNNGPAANSIG